MREVVVIAQQQFPLRALQPFPSVSMERTLSGLITDFGLLTVELGLTRTPCSVAN